MYFYHEREILGDGARECRLLYHKRRRDDDAWMMMMMMMVLTNVVYVARTRDNDDAHECCVYITNERR